MPDLTHWIIGRAWCPACQVVRLIVAHPEAVIRCPRCEGPTIRACGDEA
jgi:ribosomal protein S27E